jgi:2-polyprenyl-3-methyl-5-hydroxy-6-metoxy-1,4-benzoquinol methylase
MSTSVSAAGQHLICQRSAAGKMEHDNYSEYFFSVNSPTREAFEATARAYAACYRKFLPANKNARILDLGCGMGHFLCFLRTEGYTNYWGIDKSPALVHFSQNNVTKRVSVADVFDYLKGGGVFDVIVANDFVEHIPKSKTLNLLTSIYDSLESDGLLLVKTPNMSNPFGLRFRYIDYTHEQGFTEESLGHILRASGFKKIHIMGTPCPSHSLIARIRELRRRVAYSIIAGALRVQGYGSPRILAPNLIAVSTKAG